MTLIQILQKIRNAFYTKKEIDSMGGGTSLSDTISQKAGINHNHDSAYLGISAKAESSKSADSADSVAWANVSGKPSSYTPSSHNHDDRYYTESEIDTKLGGKSNTDHTHSNYLTGITKTMVTTALGYTPPTSDTNTHYTTTLYAGAKDAKSNAATTNGNSYIKLYDDSTVRSQLNIKGSGATSVTTDANGVITISSTDTNTTYSKLSQFTNDSGFITGITKAMVTTALGYTPPTSDTNTWNALKGSTTSAAGTAGYAPAPAAGAANRYLRCDGTWQVPPDNNTTYSNMTAATASAAGKAGLVPAPAAGKQTSFLRGDGTWVVPTNTTYSFSNKAATLAWNTAVTVATVGGVDITVKLPANPNTNTTYSAGSNITLSGTTFSLTKANVVGALGYTPPTTNTTYSKLSQFTNDSGYITSSGSCNYATSAGNGVHSSGGNWVRFNSGLQLCWSLGVNGGSIWTFPNTFLNAAHMCIFATVITNAGRPSLAVYDNATTTSVRLLIWDTAYANWRTDQTCSVLAVGLWK